MDKEIKCGICGSTNVITKWDMGFDIDPSGEEKQHEDYCNDCGAWRFNIDRIDYEGDNAWEEVKQYGEWCTKG